MLRLKCNKFYSLLIIGLLVGTLFINLIVLAGNAQKIMNLAGNISPTHPERKVLDFFANRLNEITNGEIKVEIFDSGVLGDEREMMDQMQAGTLDFARITASMLSSISKGYGLANIPFFYKDVDELLKVVGSRQFKQVVEPPLIEQGFRPIADYWGGTRDLYTLTPVYSLEDLNGMKIRTMQDPTLLEVWKALGAIPTPISFSELFSALQTGIVDGGEGSPTSFYAQSFYEVAKYLTKISYMHVYMPLCISESSWQNLSPSHKIAVLIAADEATELIIEVYNNSADEAYESAKLKGVEIINPTDMEKWQKKAEPLVYKIAEDAAGIDGKNIIDWILHSRE